MGRTLRYRPDRAAASGKTHDMTTLQLPTDHYLAGSINVVHLKHRLGDVETDRLNRCIDNSSESWELYQPPLP
jgi:hypothetical protein